MSNPTKSILWISPNHRWQILRERFTASQDVYAVASSFSAESRRYQRADYPILVTADGGRDAALIWDSPDLIPAYVKRQAERILIPLLSGGSV